MGYCRETLSLSEAVTQASAADTLSSTPPALQVCGVSYRYGREKQAKPALDQVDFTLQSGQFHALLGPNGAGKSTLFALLTRLFVPGSGTIHLFEHDLLASPAKVLADIGVVFQQSTLDLDLSVEQNLLYHGALHGLNARTTRSRMADELAQFGLADRLKEKVRQLNGGHRRRLEIVRALLHRPRMLLLDEPTVGLDLESRHYLNRRVRELCNERDLCVLWATHLMEEVYDHDAVILLHGGRIKAQGECETLCMQMGVSNITELFHHLTRSEI